MVADPANPLARDLDEVLETMGSLWDDLRGARIFITGGTGFFGCWLLETLLWANDRLDLGAFAVVLTRNAAAFRRKAAHLTEHAAVTLHTGDVRDFVFPAGRFTHVIQAASDPGPVITRLDRQRQFDTIVSGTARCLCLASDAGVSRFLVTSSGAVYGEQPADLEHMPESYSGAPEPTKRSSTYGEAKRAAELLCAIHAGDKLQPTIARCFAFCGPYLPLNSNFAVGNFVGDALNGGPIRVTGDGSPRRSYLYGSDLARWLWTILLRGDALRPYNVGSEQALSILEIAGRVAHAAGLGNCVQVTGASRLGTPPSRYVPSTRRAQDELGLTESVHLDEALRRSLAWHRERSAA